jgi:hypothetical protein
MDCPFELFLAFCTFAKRFGSGFNIDDFGLVGKLVKSSIS